MEKTKILIIDDDHNMADSLRDILELEGYEVTLKERGREALELATRQDFDCFLFDIRMPGLNGVDALKELKGLKKDPFVILMTGYSRDELIDDALKDGAADVMTKPLDIEKLLRLLEKIGS